MYAILFNALVETVITDRHGEAAHQRRLREARATGIRLRWWGPRQALHPRRPVATAAQGATR